MRNFSLSATVAGLLLAALSACHTDAIERTFSKGCWPASDTLSGPVAVAAAGEQAITLDLVFDPEYAYQNLFVKVRATSPSGKQTELLYDLELLDPGGNWLVEKEGSGFRYHQALKPGLALAETGTWNLKVFHYMRDSTLCHVRSAKVVFGKP